MWPRTCLLRVYFLCLLLAAVRTGTGGEPDSSNQGKLLFSNCVRNVLWEELITNAVVVTLDEKNSEQLTRGTNCSLVLKTFPLDAFVIKLTQFHFPSCNTRLSVLEQVDQKTQRLLDGACGARQLPEVWSTKGNLITINLNHVKEVLPTERFSFSLLVTRITPNCQSGSGFKCRQYCISKQLRCDGVEHCKGGEDETSCSPSSAPPLGGPATQRPGVSPGVSPGGWGTDSPLEENVYLWLPLIVVVVFTVVMLALILVGRRTSTCAARDAGYSAAEVTAAQMDAAATTDLTTTTTTTSRSPVTSEPSTLAPPVGADNVDIITIALVAVVFFIILIGCLVLGFREQRHRQSEDINDNLRLEINTNPGFNDGAPATPPPSYSWIERQTSYVSQISQTSSQLSIPPDYDDVVESGNDTGSNSGGGRRWRRQLGRSSSSGAARPSRRFRFFQRSLSAQEGRPTGRARYASDPSANPRRRGSTQSAEGGSTSGGGGGGGGGGEERDGANMDVDSVFLDDGGPGVHYPTAPTLSTGGAGHVLENVSEVDETLTASQASIAADRTTTTPPTGQTATADDGPVAPRLPLSAGGGTGGQQDSHSSPNGTLPETVTAGGNNPLTSGHTASVRAPQGNPHQDVVFTLGD